MVRMYKIVSIINLPITRVYVIAFIFLYPQTIVCSYIQKFIQFYPFKSRNNQNPPYIIMTNQTIYPLKSWGCSPFFTKSTTVQPGFLVASNLELFVYKSHERSLFLSTGYTLERPLLLPHRPLPSSFQKILSLQK